MFGCGYLVNLARPAHRKIPMTHQKALWYSGKYCSLFTNVDTVFNTSVKKSKQDMWVT